MYETIYFLVLHFSSEYAHILNLNCKNILILKKDLRKFRVLSPLNYRIS